MELPPLRASTWKALRRRVADNLPGARRARAVYRRQAEEHDRLAELADQKMRRDRDLQYLFVVTYGRSGSTLLQGILNSIPGYLIRGENDGAVYRLFKYHQACRTAKRRRARGGATDERHPWFGIDSYPERRALQAIRWLVLDTLLRPEPDSRVVGFKEIRWGQDDLAAYVRFLRRAFPDARFVVNTRSHEAVSRSRWWADRPDAFERLAHLERRHTEALEPLGDAVFRVHFDDYIADPAALRPLFDWLGEEYDELRVRAVIDRPSSY